MESFNLEKDNRDKSKPSSYPFAVITGPILLVRFTFGKHLVYLFGDDHDNLKNTTWALSVDVKSDGTQNFTGNDNSNVSIERLLYMFYARAYKQNAHLNLFFEILPSKEMMEYPSEGFKSRFDRLVQLFKIHEEKREKNITLNPVDFRVTGDEEGSGDYQSLALNYFSLFLMMFEEKEYDEIDQLFPVNEIEWDIKMLKDTLMDDGEIKKIQIPDKYKEYFKDVENTVGKYVQSEYFNNLPHEKLKLIIREIIDKKVQSIASEYLEFRRNSSSSREILITKIRAMHLWYMDIPAFCKMMEKISARPGLTVGYFGADHVSNLVPMISKIDPYFTVHVGKKREGIDLLMDIREEVLQLI